MRLFSKKKTVSTQSASDTQMCNELTENVECNLVSKIRTAQDSLDEVQKRIDELSSMQRYLHSEMWKLFLDVNVYRTLYASGRKQPGEHVTAYEVEVICGAISRIDNIDAFVGEIREIHNRQLLIAEELQKKRTLQKEIRDAKQRLGIK